MTTPNAKTPAEAEHEPDLLDGWIARAKKGALDPDGFEVARIIAKNDEHGFLLYLTTDDQLRMNSAHEVPARVQQALLGVASETDSDAALASRFNLRKANALHLWLRGETANSVVALRQLALDIAAYKKNRARGPYVAGALALCMLLLLAAGVLRASFWPKMGAFWCEVICVVAFGGLGGTLSCVVGSESVVESAPVGVSAFIWGGLRVVVGALFAAAALVLMHADLVLSFMKNLGLYGVSATALVAGFSESFVPDAMKLAAKPMPATQPLEPGDE